MQAGPQNRVIVKEKIDNGKGGPTNTTDHEEVYQTFAIRVCEGEVDLLRFWIEGKLAYSALGELPADSTVANTKFKFYRGDEEQMPDPSLEALPPENGGGVGNVPAYRGTAYIVFDNFNSTPYGGRIPQIQFQVSTVATIAQNCFEEGLIAWYPLDDASGGGPCREIVAGRNGIYSASVTGAGPLGNGSTGSMRIDADGDWMVVKSDVSGFAPVSVYGVPFTVSIWAQQEGPQAHYAANIVNSGTTGATPGYEFGMGFDGGTYNTPFAGSGTVSGTSTYIHGPVGMTSAWFTMTYDGSSTYKLFLNGAWVATGTGLAQNVGTMLQIGWREFPGSNGFRGLVSDLKIYNYAMTDQQVADAFVGITTPIWELPEAPGTFIDSQGNIVPGCQDTATLGSIYLDDIVSDIAGRAGVDASQLDLAEDQVVEVTGYIIGQQTTAQGALAPLATAYFRDYPEYDLKIHSVPRGQAVVAQLTDDDFVESTEDERSLQQKIELPRRINLAYADKDGNYSRRIQKAERESGNIPSTGTTELEFPLVFTSNQAAQKAEIVLKVTTEEALGTLKRKLPGYKHADLVATDRIGYDTKEWRITKLDWLDGLIDFEAKRDRVSNYTSAAVGGSALDPTAPVSNVRGPSILQMLNLPRLTTAENTPGMYGGVTGVTAAWPGADIYMSTDDGASFVKVVTITQRATMGELVSDVTSSSEPITVLVYNERLLSSVTAEQLASNINGFALTTSGTSEIGQFQTAVESADHEFELTDVTRGRRDTIAAAHVAGDDFLLLDDAIFFVPIDSSHIGRTLIFRAVTRGTPIENNDTISVVYDPYFTGPADVDFYTNESGTYYTDQFGNRYEVNTL